VTSTDQALHQLGPDSLAVIAGDHITGAVA
jgi:hypothetical protein